MADSRPEWVVYEGEGDGPGPEVVREFVLYQGGGERVTSKDEQSNTGTAASWVGEFKEAVKVAADAVEAALTRAHLGEIDRLNQAHLGELDRLEARLEKQKDEEIGRLKEAHERQIEAIRAQYAVHMATQSAGVEQVIQARMKALLRENEELRAQLIRR